MNLTFYEAPRVTISIVTPRKCLMNSNYASSSLNMSVSEYEDVDWSY